MGQSDRFTSDLVVNPSTSKATNLASQQVALWNPDGTPFTGGGGGSGSGFDDQRVGPGLDYDGVVGWSDDVVMAETGTLSMPYPTTAGSAEGGSNVYVACWGGFTDAHMVAPAGWTEEGYVNTDDRTYAAAYTKVTDAQVAAEDWDWEGLVDGYQWPLGVCFEVVDADPVPVRQVVVRDALTDGYEVPAMSGLVPGASHIVLCLVNWNYEIDWSLLADHGYTPVYGLDLDEDVYWDADGGYAYAAFAYKVADAETEPAMDHSFGSGPGSDGAIIQLEIRGGTVTATPAFHNSLGFEAGDIITAGVTEELAATAASEWIEAHVAPDLLVGDFMGANSSYLRTLIVEPSIDGTSTDKPWVGTIAPPEPHMRTEVLVQNGDIWEIWVRFTQRSQIITPYVTQEAAVKAAPGYKLLLDTRNTYADQWTAQYPNPDIPGLKYTAETFFTLGRPIIEVTSYQNDPYLWLNTWSTTAPAVVANAPFLIKYTWLPRWAYPGMVGPANQAGWLLEMVQDHPTVFPHGQ